MVSGKSLTLRYPAPDSPRLSTTLTRVRVPADSALLNVHVTISPGLGSMPEIVVPVSVPVVVPFALTHDADESCQPVATVSDTEWFVVELTGRSGLVPSPVVLKAAVPSTVKEKAAVV